jgi:hypothetical protein
MIIKKIFNLALVLAILISLSSCQDEWDYSYPFIKTVSVENYDDTSAVFTGEIVNLGNDEIQEYGYFLAFYGYEYFPYKENKNEEGKFEMFVSTSLRKGVTVKFGAYAKVNDKIILGNKIAYTCTENVMPEIVSISPISGDRNTTRTMVVKNLVEAFGYYLYFDGIQYAYTNLTIVGPNTIEFNISSSHIEAGEYEVSLYNYGMAEYTEKITITN